jgi:metal-dependent amidase/aminoacylase/carboxypeptidase family protein
MEKHGFTVTRNYHLETAWVATYTCGQGGHVLGVNSEMDALPGIGHACGHNLIGISGVAVALAAKAALENLRIDGKVVLLGTPGKFCFCIGEVDCRITLKAAEEGGFGKVILYEKGAYDEMDVCLMSVSSAVHIR